MHSNYLKSLTRFGDTAFLQASILSNRAGIPARAPGDGRFDVS
jgi:hypothetical protein